MRRNVIPLSAFCFFLYSQAMIRLSALSHFAVISLMLCLLSGCVPAGDGLIDEKKDPHYLRAKSLKDSQDPQSAIAEFEKAIQSNPRAALAHLQLGLLCEQANKNYAEAIYHYQKHIELQPKSDYAERARDQIKVCTRELAKGEFSQPNSQYLQRELDRLVAENAQFKLQIESMRTQLVASASALATAERAVAAAEAQRDSAVALASARSILARTSARPDSSTTSQSGSSFSSTRRGIHIVKSGETLSSIADRYGLRASAIQAANPKVNPRRLRAGQSLVLPLR